MTIGEYLPPHLEQFIRDQLASGHFRSESEVIYTALQLLEEKAHSPEALRAWLKQEIDKGMWSKPSGPITREFWEQLRSRIGGAGNERKALAERTHARLEKLRTRYGTFSDSARLIREDRDARG